MLEDYAPGSPHRPLSSVALQFLVSVYSSSQSCSTQTEYLKFPTITFHPSNETVFLTSYNESINVTLTCMANETSSYYWARQDGSIPLSATGLRTNTLTLYDVQPNLPTHNNDSLFLIDCILWKSCKEPSTLFKY